MFLSRVSAWRASRAREMKPVLPDVIKGHNLKAEIVTPFEEKAPSFSQEHQPAVCAHTPAIFPAFFVLFPCLCGCRKAAAFLRLLFKAILKDAATAAPSTRAVTVSVCQELAVAPVSAV